MLQLKVLNLGCGGNHKYKNAINYCLDYDKSLKCERIKHDDFNDKNKLPYPNIFFDVVIAEMFVEHICRIEKLLNEVKRVLKPNGIFYFTVPHQNSIYAWGNPEHKHAFLLNSFNPEEYWMKDWVLINHEFIPSKRKLGIISCFLSKLVGSFSELFIPLFNKYVNLSFTLKKKY